VIYVCCGMRRGGSTLQYNLVISVLKKQYSTVIGGGYIKNGVELERVRSSFELQNAHIVIKCHDFIEEVDRLVMDGQAKTFYVYRDLRDAAISYCTKYEISLEKAIREGFIERVIRESNLWCAVPDTYVASYEAMINDLEYEILGIADLLGVPLTSQQSRSIAKDHSLEATIKRISAFDFESDGLKLGRDSIIAESQLHSNHISSGKINQWKSLPLLNIYQIEIRASEWLQNRGYELKTNRSTRVFVNAMGRFLQLITIFKV